MLACTLSDRHLPCTAQHSIAPGKPMAKLQRQPSSIGGSTAGLRRGMVVRWVPLRAKASVWHCTTVHWPTDRLGALVVNICSRDCTICPRPSGVGGGRQNISPVATGFAVFYEVCDHGRLRSTELQSAQLIVKTFYFSNLKETSKNSVQSLYYLFTKAGVLSLRNMRAGTKKGWNIK